jgi:hypothetical protein
MASVGPQIARTAAPFCLGVAAVCAVQNLGATYYETLLTERYCLYKLGRFRSLSSRPGYGISTEGTEDYAEEVLDQFIKPYNAR